MGFTGSIRWSVFTIILAKQAQCKHHTTGHGRTRTCSIVIYLTEERSCFHLQNIGTSKLFRIVLWLVNKPLVLPYCAGVSVLFLNSYIKSGYGLAKLWAGLQGIRLFYCAMLTFLVHTISMKKECLCDSKFHGTRFASSSSTKSDRLVKRWNTIRYFRRQHRRAWKQFWACRSI